MTTKDVNPFALLEAAGWDAAKLPKEAGGKPSPASVRALGELAARTGYVVGRVSSTYLKTLVGTAQGIAGTTGGDYGPCITGAHLALYAEVKAGVSAGDLAADETDTKADKARKALERNTRTNFARTAVSTLHGFVRAGGDLMSLNPADVTKDQLRRDTLALSTKAATRTTGGTRGSLKKQLELDVDYKCVALIDSLRALKDANQAQHLAELCIEKIAKTFGVTTP